MRASTLFLFSFAILGLISCGGEKKESAPETAKTSAEPFEVEADRFADLQVLRYEVKGFEGLSPKQKELAYYLYEAALCGRDMIYDQKYKHNLLIRKTNEAIWESFKGDKSTPNWKAFEEYAKRVWFSNGIHHHYSNDKMVPAFDKAYLKELIDQSDENLLPLEGRTREAFYTFIEPLILDPNVDRKIVDQSAGIDNILASSNNFYEGVTQKEVEQFYTALKKKGEKDPVMYGLNSKVVKENGKVTEKVWKVGGMYTQAIEKVVYWLNKAVEVAENEEQKDALQKLVKYYQTGDLKDFDAYCISWVKDVNSDIDVVNGFIEVYGDAIGKKGSYEAVVSLKDKEASKTIAAIASEAQWFEDNSPILPEHKKKDVKGITAKVIQAIVETGDSGPSTPVGINLPNSNWIREQHGSKSVSLGNIVEAYDVVASKSPLMKEFAFDEASIERAKKYASLAGALHTDMHEVIGHASGKINEGVGTPDVTLKNYANCLEEARADLVALYFILDPKLVDIGVMPSTEVGKAEYDNYILNGLMTQLTRIKAGDNIEEAHMRNRQLVAKWAYEKGKSDKVIEFVKRDNKTYVRVNDYEKLRKLFGDLLREIQRIKSEGDYKAATDLVENYGVKVDRALHDEILARYQKLNIAPYKGFIQPRLVPVMDGEKITDVKIEYPKDFAGQMLEYGRKYGFLPVRN